MKPDFPINILVLCTGNSARSIMCQGLLNTLGHGKIKAYSAGSHPTGKVNEFALHQLTYNNCSLGEPPRSKSWDEFINPKAPKMDMVITVCDQAAGESCPLWPGQPLKLHWGFADPAAVTATDILKERAFAEIFNQIKTKVTKFLALPFWADNRLNISAMQQQIINFDNNK